VVLVERAKTNAWNTPSDTIVTTAYRKQPFLLNVLVWLHVPDKLRPSGAMGCLVESHRQAQVVMEA
jgi:hypothetical protein